MRDQWIADGRRIAETLWQAMPKVWDGKKCVRYLKREQYNWKQTEWIGWYFEHRARAVLTSALGGGQGPRFGNVDFDYGTGITVWDFKAHAIPKRDGWIFLNDVDAVDQCVGTHGGLGWVIAGGDALYDEDGTFKDWHDTLKGDESAYVVDRKRRGAPSRLRKRQFQLKHITVAVVRSPDEIELAMEQKLLTSTMQASQRNADGSRRASKYGLHGGRVTQALENASLDRVISLFRFPSNVTS